MRSVIAAIMAILGVVLVLGGSAVAVGVGAGQDPDRRVGSQHPDAGGGRLERGLEVAGRLPGADRLITWGVVLLALSAVAAGAITFSATATAGTN